MVRHEIIALHLATEKGKAEFYPSCQQIKVGGSGTGVPSQDQLVMFPGAYSDDDPGIFDPQVRFTPANPLIRLTESNLQVFDPSAQYTFPGGPVATLGTSGGGDGNGTSTNISSSTRKPKPTTTNTKSPAVPTSTGDPATGDPSNCSLKKNRSLLKRSSWKDRSSDYGTRPHRVSRIMGRLSHGARW